MGKQEKRCQQIIIRIFSFFVGGLGRRTSAANEQRLYPQAVP